MFITSPNLGRWCRHHTLLKADIAAITVTERQPRSIGELGLVHMLRNIHGLACWYVDSCIPLRRACFPFATLSHANACALFFENRVQFNAQQAELRFDARDVALPLRRNEKALQTMLQRTVPLTVLQYRCDQRDRLLAQQVRQVLGNTAHMPRTAPAAQSLAATLNLSPHFLHRQLQEEGAHSEKRVTCCREPPNSSRKWQRPDSGTRRASTLRFRAGQEWRGCFERVKKVSLLAS